MHHLVAIVVIALAFWILPAFANAQEEAPTAPDEKYDQVVVMAVMTGEPAAMHMLGRTFEAEWWGITPDYSVSVRWYLLAALQGHVKSQEKILT